MMTLDLFGNNVEIWKLLMTFGILLAAAEIFVPSFIALPIGLAFIATAIFAPLVTSMSAILLILAVNLLVMVFLFQWILKKRLSNPDMPSNADALIGKDAIAMSNISASVAGQAKVFSEVWTALSEGSEVVLSGERATIIRIDGNKLIVSKK